MREPITPLIGIEQFFNVRKTVVPGGESFGFSAIGPEYTPSYNNGVHSATTTEMGVLISGTEGTSILFQCSQTMALTVTESNRRIALIVRDSTNSAKVNAQTADNAFPLDEFFVLRVSWDLVARRCRVWVNGVIVMSPTVNSNTGVHVGNKRYSLMRTSYGPTGRFQYFNLWQGENEDGSLPSGDPFLELSAPAAAAESNEFWTRAGSPPT